MKTGQGVIVAQVTNFSFLLLALADIHKGDHRAYDFSVLDLGVGETLRSEGSAVRPPEYLVFRVQAFFVSQCPEDPALLHRILAAIRVCVKYQLMHVFAQQLCFIPVPEHVQAASVAESAISISVDAVDGFGRGVQDQAQVFLVLIQQTDRGIQFLPDILPGFLIEGYHEQQAEHSAQNVKHGLRVKHRGAPPGHVGEDKIQHIAAEQQRNDLCSPAIEQEIGERGHDGYPDQRVVLVARDQKKRDLTQNQSPDGQIGNRLISVGLHEVEQREKGKNDACRIDRGGAVHAKEKNVDHNES